MRTCPRCRSIYATELSFCGLDGARLEPMDRDSLIGETIGRFRVFERLGFGAMGSVYRAHDIEHGRDVALKVLFGERACEPKALERFRREARAAARITHPNVVEVFDHGATDAGLNYLSMELLRGKTLKSVLAEEGSIDVLRAARIARQIARALDEAHRAGFVHRDLKPANIMLVGGAEGEIAKVLDFGLVALVDRSEESDELTTTGTSLGTPAYMAPEQTEYSTVDASADLYALGCISYEMLAGRPPFLGDSRQVAKQHLAERPAALERGRVLEPLVMWLLEKQPYSRPESAQVVVAELDAIESKLVSGDGISSAPRRPKPNRARWFVASAAIPIAAVAIAISAPSSQLPEPIAVPRPPPPGEVREKAPLPAPSPVIAPVTEKPAPAPAPSVLIGHTAAPVRAPARPIASTAEPPSPANEIEAPPPPPPLTEDAPEPAPEIGPGFVNVAVAQRGEMRSTRVLVDGVILRERTPCRIELPAGPHLIEVRLAGAPPLRRSIAVSPGAVERVVFELSE